MAFRQVADPPSSRSPILHPEALQTPQRLGRWRKGNVQAGITEPTYTQNLGEMRIDPDSFTGPGTHNRSGEYRPRSTDTPIRAGTIVPDPDFAQLLLDRVG